jgi:hypothetical protein
MPRRRWQTLLLHAVSDAVRSLIILAPMLYRLPPRSNTSATLFRVRGLSNRRWRNYDAVVLRDNRNNFVDLTRNSLVVGTDSMVVVIVSRLRWLLTVSAALAGVKSRLIMSWLVCCEHAAANHPRWAISPDARQLGIYDTPLAIDHGAHDLQFATGVLDAA